MDEIRKSLFNDSPFDGDPGVTGTPTQNDFGVMQYAGGQLGAETTHAVDLIPDQWWGLEVGLICRGGQCWVAFTTNPTNAEVDRGAAAGQAGNATKVGVPLPNSVSVETRMRLPRPAKGQKLYFVRESDTIGTIVTMRVLAR